MNKLSPNKFIVALGLSIMSLSSSVHAQGIHYVDWQSLEVMHDSSNSPATPGVTYNASSPQALGVISDGTQSANVTISGCLVHDNVASGTHLAVLDGTSNLFSTSSHSPSINLTDHLVTDIGNAGTTDLVFYFGGAHLTNVVLHLSDAFRTSGSNTGAYKNAHYLIISDEIDSIEVNTPNTGAGSHKWITENVNATTDRLKFGSNSITEGTIVLNGQISGFTLRSSVENHTRFQIGTEKVPEPSSSLLILLSGVTLLARRKRA